MAGPFKLFRHGRLEPREDTHAQRRAVPALPFPPGIPHPGRVGSLRRTPGPDARRKGHGGRARLHPGDRQRAAVIECEAMDEAESILQVVAQRVGMDGADGMARAVQRGLIDRLARAEADSEQWDADEAAAAEAEGSD